MQGRVVIVTGASSGIGAALSKTLSAMGASVVLAARNEEAMREVALSCKNPVLIHRCDVTRRGDHEALLAAALAHFGKVDTWVNNAGVGISKSVQDITDEDMDLMISANVKSVVYGMQTAVRHFKTTRSGHVVNVSSVLGRLPSVPFRSMYSASKAAVNSLTANMRMEMKVEGFTDIHIALYSPGLVATTFGSNAVYGGPDSRTLPGAQDVEEVAQQMAQMIADPAATVDTYSRPPYKDAVVGYFSAADIREAESKVMIVARPPSPK